MAARERMQMGEHSSAALTHGLSVGQVSAVLKATLQPSGPMPTLLVSNVPWHDFEAALGQHLPVLADFADPSLHSPNGSSPSPQQKQWSNASVAQVRSAIHSVVVQLLGLESVEDYVSLVPPQTTYLKVVKKKSCLAKRHAIKVVKPLRSSYVYNNNNIMVFRRAPWNLRPLKSNFRWGFLRLPPPTMDGGRRLPPYL